MTKKVKPPIARMLDGYVEVLNAYCKAVCGKTGGCSKSCPVWKFSAWLISGRK
jgi:hypothetical protein